MKTLFFTITIFCSLFISSRAQVSHEFSVGLVGNRVLEANPPDFVIWDLDYLFGPQLGYQLYFLESGFSIKADAGWLHEAGQKEYGSLIPGGDNEYEETTRRRAVAVDLAGGYDFLQFNKSFLQVSAGMRANKFYYFQSKTERTDRKDIPPNFTESDGWRDFNFGILTSLSYQFFLTDKPNLKRQSIAFRIDADFTYMFPTYYRLGTIENEFATINTGLTISMIWRLRGK